MVYKSSTETLYLATTSRCKYAKIYLNFRDFYFNLK